jgi:hypothetical protein
MADRSDSSSRLRARASRKGLRLRVLDPRPGRGPLLSFSFATEDDAEEAKDAVREALGKAVHIEHSPHHPR